MQAKSPSKTATCSVLSSKKQKLAGINSPSAIQSNQQQRKATTAQTHYIVKKRAHRTAGRLLARLHGLTQSQADATSVASVGR